jgi:uncharacterized protein (TIGR02266 family)
MAERRRTVRAIARIEVFDRGARQERVPLYVSGNVSAGGIFLITQEPIATGTNLKISFTLPDDDRPIEAMGQVIWQRDQRTAPDRQPGMGVQFMKIAQDDQDRVRAFVHSQVEKGEVEKNDD